MVSLAQVGPDAAHRDATASAAPSLPLDVTVYDSLDAAEAAWHALEHDAVLTPYQRHDWLKHLIAAGAEPQGRVVIATVSRGGKTLALLPLLVEGKLHRRARFLGADQSNSDWMVLAPGFDPNADELRTIFGDIARAAGGIDLLLIQNQPMTWAGRSNPLLRLPHTPGASNLYTTTIAGTPVPYIDTRIPPKHRGNLRRGRRRMEETLGPVRLVRVGDAALLARVHEAFLEQRSTRFAEMGIANVFAQPMFRAFFRDAATADVDAHRPVMVAHALMAGDEIVATCWGTTSGDHYSLYINSTTSGSASRFSLMGILIGELMDQLLAEGIVTFDLGLGDFDYKHEWTEPQTVYHGIIPLTARGRIAAAAMQGRTTLKRTIKQNPKLWQLANRVRRGLYRLTGKSNSA